VIVLPHADRLTDNICSCLEHFVRIIKENPFFIERLSDESVITDHFDDQS